MAEPSAPSSADPGSSKDTGDPAETPASDAGSTYDLGTAPTVALVIPQIVSEIVIAPAAAEAPASIEPPPAQTSTEPSRAASRPSFLARTRIGIAGSFQTAANGLTRFAEAGLGFLWAYVLASIALGSAIWFLKHRDHLPELLTNKVAWDLQLQTAVEALSGATEMFIKVWF